MGVLTQKWTRMRSSKLATNASWMMVGQGFSVVTQAVYFAILARLLGAVEYGTFVGAFAFTSIAAQFSTLGSGTVFLRYVSGNRAAYSRYWGNVLTITFVVGGALVAILYVTGRAVLNPASASLVLLAAIANCLCSQLTTETGRVFQTFEQMRVTAIVNMLTNTVRALTAGGMLLVLHHASAWQWAVASTIVSAVAALVAVGRVTWSFGWPKIFPIMFPKHGLEGFEYSLATSTSTIYNDLDKTLLSHFEMNLANGIYTVAYRVIDIASLPILSIRDAAMPRLFASGRSGMMATALLSRKLMNRTLPLGIAMSVAVFLVAPVLPMIVGHGFTGSVAALRWLCLIPFFRSIHQMTGSAMTASGHQRYRTIAQVAAAGLNCAMNLLLIPQYGWLGAAWTSLVTDGALAATNWALLQMLSHRLQPSMA